MIKKTMWLLALLIPCSINCMGLNIDLFEAVRNGRISTVRSLLERGENPNVTIDGISPLFAAISGGFTEVVRLLLRYGADPNFLDGDGNSALLFATVREHVAILQCLLQAGADPNLKGTDNGFTPLIIAAGTGQTAVIEKLLQAGADLNLKGTEKGLTPLITAASMGQTAAIGLLLKRGADPDIRQGSSLNLWTPYRTAWINGNTEAQQLLGDWPLYQQYIRRTNTSIENPTVLQIHELAEQERVQQSQNGSGCSIQ